MHDSSKCTDDSHHLQIRLSSEDLRMMIDEASDNDNGGVGTVGLKTFIGIMANSAW
jgi:hypothetical protein